MISQKATTQFESDCKRAKVIIDNDMPAGSIHDFLLQLKGHVVDAMVKNQKDEEEKQKKSE